MLKQSARYSDGAESRASGVKIYLVFIRAGEEWSGRGLSRPEKEKIVFFVIMLFLWLIFYKAWLPDYCSHTSLVVFNSLAVLM